MDKQNTIKLLEILRGSYRSSDFVEIASYIFFGQSLIKKYQIPDSHSLSDVFKLPDIRFNDFEKGIVEDLEKVFPLPIIDGTIEKISEFTKLLADTELADILFNISIDSGEYATTPHSLMKLILAILDIKNNENIMDLCSGYGIFLATVLHNTNHVYLHGRDINLVASLVSKILLYLLGTNADIKTQDVLLDVENTLYDKVFSHFPFLLKLGRFNYEEINQISHFKFDSRISTDWIFVLKILNSLKATGKGLAIIHDGPLYKSQDIDFRKYLVDNGLIEAVIQLPERLLYNTSVGINLLVLSKNGFKSEIKLIDASGKFIKGRRVNELSEAQMNEIVVMYLSDNYFIDTNEIVENRYVLSPKHYSNKVEINNPIMIKEIAIDIFRGVQLTANELDAGYVEDHTFDYKILNLGNISDTTIDYDGLQKIILEGEKWNNYLLKDKDFVLSAKGATLKTSVIELKENEKILASGNLMVIRVNQGRINPYYLKVFLDSLIGRKLLNSVQTGSVYLSIGKQILEEMPIPLLPIEKQNQIANKYFAYNDEINYYKKKIQSIQNKLDNLFIDESGGE